MTELSEPSLDGDDASTAKQSPDATHASEHVSCTVGRFILTSVQSIGFGEGDQEAKKLFRKTPYQIGSRSGRRLSVPCLKRRPTLLLSVLDRTFTTALLCFVTTLAVLRYGRAAVSLISDFYMKSRRKDFETFRSDFEPDHLL